MADPATIAMAVKTAVAIATDKNTWKTAGAVIAGFLFILLLPFLLIMSIGGGGAKHNQDVSRVVFNGSPVPPGLSSEYAQYITEMQEAFGKLNIAVDDVNGELESESLDDIRVKAYFYTLYFGTDLTGFDDAFFADFAQCFVKTELVTDPATAAVSEKLVPVKDLSEITANVSSLTGKEITDDIRQNISNLYNYIKFGYAADSWSGGIAGEAFSDENFARLMTEATKFIGYPYVWGGSSPSTSFDCSGFVCWSYTQSGVYNLPRTTAQGIYSQCSPVSKDELKPGDLVFFTGTYAGAPTVSHIGIYVGDGKMLHAGDPIGYANLNSSYWIKHFLGYGRLI